MKRWAPRLVWLVVLWGVWTFLPKLAARPTLVNRAGGSLALFDRRGEILNVTLSHDEKYRVWVSLHDIAPVVVEATLQREDRRFYQHSGVNLIALGRAAGECLLKGTDCRGASTITMQLARVRYRLQTRSLLGKLSQIWRARVIEAHYSKDEILEAYLNLISYGGNIEGVGAAALLYFHKHANALSSVEAAVVAAIPQSPSRRTLFSSAGLQEARRHAVVAGDVAVYEKSEVPRAIPHLAQRLIQSAPSGEILTTIDSSIQKIVEEGAAGFVDRNRKLGIVNTAVVVLDHVTMAVRAYLGSVDYYAREIQGAVDGVQARRSPGSALKPLLYARAMERGLIHPQSLLKDTPYTVSSYNPENYERDFLGPLTATQALVLSRNIPAVQISHRLGEDGLYELLKRVEIGGLQRREHYGLALTLGGVEVTLEELVQLYAAIAHNGIFRRAQYLQGSGATQQQLRILSPAASYLVREMLKENPRTGTASVVMPGLRSMPLAIPWKTGTSFGFRDAWAIGMVGQFVVAVWVGNFDGRPNPAFIGREAAGPLLFAVADRLSSAGLVQQAPTLVPAEVREVQVCSVSGQLPGPHCKFTRPTLFIPGVSPIDSCSVHRLIRTDRRTGLQVCADELIDPQQLRSAIFEVWPSDIITLFRQAGISRTAPPPLPLRCRTGGGGSRGPQILSPQGSLEYVLHGSAPLNVPLQAVVDGDAELFWFLDDRLLGRVHNSETIHVETQPGEYVIRVVDSNGGANAVRLRVTRGMG